MARTGATQPQTSGRRPGEDTGGPPASAKALRVALYAALAASAGFAGAILYVHAQLAASHGAYTSFCNVNTLVNCDAVLASRFSMLLGVPLAGWALVAYGGLALLVAWQGGATGPTRTQATLLLLWAAIWGLVFSLYMAGIAVFVVGALCVLCAGMYVLSLAFALLAWRLARRELGPAPLLSAPRVGIGAAAIAGSIALVAGTQLSTVAAPLLPVTPEEVRKRHPEFYRWYATRPMVDPGLLPPPEHVKGPADAPFTIVEFSDFECTYCAKAFRDLQELERLHGGSLRIVFHHFPLDAACNPRVQGRLHRNACLAAIAAECAAREGRFWAYHDLLFDAQGRLGREDLITHAAGLGIDRAAFTTCLDDPDPAARVRADAEAGGRLGVKSTPTLILNGRAVEGALEREAYEYALAMERDN